MDSAKPTMAVALADERLGMGWHRSRTRIRVVAVLCSLLAAATVFGLFNEFRASSGEAKPEKQLIATIDLRIGTPALAAERGEAQARQDVETGLLQLEAFGPATPPAQAKRLKQHFGFAWISKGEEATPLSQAHADAYNRVMQAEIERRHGREFLDRLMREQGGRSPSQDKTERP
jgi:hypothetical protein